MIAKATLVIADDHEILRDGIAKHLTGSGGFQVVASVGDAQSAVHACARLHPDMLLLDIEMPGRDALAAIADVRAASPDTRIVILTAFCRDAFIDLAIRGGAVGYLLKIETPPSLLDALRRIAQGESVFSEAVRTRMALPEHGAGTQSPRQSRLADLTPRELEVLRYIGRGWANDRMATVMHLSQRTVERHIARLMESAAIHDRGALMKYAFEQGLVV